MNYAYSLFNDTGCLGKHSINWFRQMDRHKDFANNFPNKEL